MVFRLNSLIAGVPERRLRWVGSSRHLSPQYTDSVRKVTEEIGALRSTRPCLPISVFRCLGVKTNYFQPPLKVGNSAAAVPASPFQTPQNGKAPRPASQRRRDKHANQLIPPVSGIAVILSATSIPRPAVYPKRPPRRRPRCHRINDHGQTDTAPGTLSHEHSKNA